MKGKYYCIVIRSIVLYYFEETLNLLSDKKRHGLEENVQPLDQLTVGHNVVLKYVSPLTSQRKQ